jgi:bacillithiol system protein YtxJ
MRAMKSLTDLDEAVQHSYDRPIVIFKHSATCGTSAFAFEEMEELIALEPAAEVFVVSIPFGRPVSNEIARRFGVRHESPQVLVLRDGGIAWHASHFRVTREGIASALAGIGPAGRGAPGGLGA